MNTPLCLGLDTSNYTTSVALFDGVGGKNVSRLLDVVPGELGLRQSEAHFQHVKHLPELFRKLHREMLFDAPIQAVGASTRPRAVDDSYMPCFLAGESQGRTLATVLKVPFFPFSHQQGHLAAAAWSAGHMDLLDHPLLAWHLSGGTTELLHVVPNGASILATRVGGTSDLSAGQLIDRTGILLKLAFPAGKALDALSTQSNAHDFYSVKLNGLTFSLSGMENKVKTMAEQGSAPELLAHFVLHTIADIVCRATAAAREKYPNLPVLCSGGVASNSMLRQALRDAIFAKPCDSADNAMGAAILTWRGLIQGGERCEERRGNSSLPAQ